MHHCRRTSMLPLRAFVCPSIDISNSAMRCGRLGCRRSWGLRKLITSWTERCLLDEALVRVAVAARSPTSGVRQSFSGSPGSGDRQGVTPVAGSPCQERQPWWVRRSQNGVKFRSPAHVVGPASRQEIAGHNPPSVSGSPYATTCNSSDLTAPQCQPLVHSPETGMRRWRKG